MTEASRELGVGKSTAHRLLMTLVSEDFALRDPVHRRYHPGKALVAAGLSALGDFDVRKRAGGPMRVLADRLSETVKLVVLQGPFARVLEVIESDQTVQVGGSVGELLPANATAAGKLLLSQESEEMLRQRFGDRLPSLTDRTITDWDDLAVELQKIRQRGWSENIGESTGGVNGLAVPVSGHAVQMVAALAVAAPADRLTPATRLDMVKEMLMAVNAMNLRPDVPRGRHAADPDPSQRSSGHGHRRGV